MLVRSRWLVFSCALALASCVGAIEDPDNMNLDVPPRDIEDRLAHCDEDPPSLGVIPTRRLSPAEFRNTVRDLLLGHDASPTAALPFDEVSFPIQATERGFENFVANTSSVPARVVESYAQTAFLAAHAIMTNTSYRERLVGCEGADVRACGGAFLDSFGRRALRRPLRDDERARYLAFIEDKTEEIDFDGALELTIAALLQAPEFTYRVETQGDSEIGPYETASRLSYLLWQSMPDDTLFEAAADDALRTEAQIEAQAIRMMNDPRALSALTDFHRQWLQFAKMDEDKHNRKDPETFPEWSPALQSAIHEESERFVEHVMSDPETATMEELLTSRTTFVNPVLAEHYGLGDVGSGWSEAELPAGERAGILTRANFLAGRGLVGWGSPIFRGTFIIEHVLCDHLGAPPADAPGEVEDPPEGELNTNRTRYEEITAPDDCQSCHARINPIGFAFEHYSSTGAFRDLDNGFPVDASGALLGTDNDGEVDDAVELSERLAESEDVLDCAAQTWVAYSLGRRVEDEDVCYIRHVRESFRASGGNVRELMLDIVRSPEFRLGTRR